MSGTSPNRIRSQMSARDQIMYKKSGDQHLEPQDESSEAPHRPHRVNRQDLQKMASAPQRDEEE